MKHSSRRHSFTLIEMLVGLFLFSILITTLFQAFRIISHHHHNTNIRKELAYSKRRLQFTLSNYYDKLSSASREDLSVTPGVRGPILSFTASGFIDRDPLFFGERIISLQREGDDLTLVETSKEQPSAQRKQTLVKHCTDFTCRFIYFNPTSPALFSETKELIQGSLPHAILLKVATSKKRSFDIALLTPPDVLNPYIVNR